MKLRKEHSIAVVFDAVSISKDIEVIGGPNSQNYYADSNTFIPNRFLTPLLLKPIVYVADPNKVIPDGNKFEELTECTWYENGKQIFTGDDYIINKNNTLTVKKNSQVDLDISYSAKWFDPRKKQSISIEDSITLVSISLAESAFNPRLTLSKPQNWIHNPLKGERVYTINAYISTDKVYEGAVEWYYIGKDKKEVLIDEKCLFYEGGQYTNALDVNSDYLNNCIIKAKNISKDKMKEIYWFFNDQGNPITHKEPEQTILEGTNVFSIPENAMKSVVPNYRFDGLTVQNLVENGDFSDGTNRWVIGGDKNSSLNDGVLTLIGGTTALCSTNTRHLEEEKLFVNFEFYLEKDSDSIKVNYNQGPSPKYTGKKGWNKYSGFIYNTGKLFAITFSRVSADVESFKITNLMAFNLTQTFGAGNEPSKEWCDANLPDYVEGTKSVQLPMRVKSVGENILSDVGGLHTRIDILDGKKCIVYKADRTASSVDLGNGAYAANTRYHINIHYNTEKPTDMQVIYTDDSVTKIVLYGGNQWLTKYLYTKEGKTIRKISGVWNSGQNVYISLEDSYISKTNKYTPYVSSMTYINNSIDIKSVGEVKDYIENGVLYRNISNDGEILEETEVINLSTNGSLTTYPNGTVFIEPVTYTEQQYNDGIKTKFPIVGIESIKVGTKYLDVSKAVINDNLITHPDLENGDFVTVTYYYDSNPIYGENEIGYLDLQSILNTLFLDDVYTYKAKLDSSGKPIEWELVKLTDVENYEEWLAQRKESPYALAPDGIIFGDYSASTKFLRQFPSSLYVDIIIPNRLKDGATQVKARALVGTKDYIIDNPSKYFKITWLKRANKAGAEEEIIGYGEEIIIDAQSKDAITIEIEDLGTYKAMTDENGKYLFNEENKLITAR